MWCSFIDDVNLVGHVDYSVKKLCGGPVWLAPLRDHIAETLGDGEKAIVSGVDELICWR
jgi:hypothetical protein